MEKYNEPQIYVVNNKEIAEKLEEEYIVATGDLGTVKNIVYGYHVESRYVKLEFDMINNLHEYKAIVIDLQTDSDVRYCKDNEEPYGTPYLFKVSYPQTQFVPIPFVLSIIKDRASRKCVKIVFADSEYTETYNIAETIGQGRYDSPEKSSNNIYGFIGSEAKNKSGKRIISEKSDLGSLIFSYAKEYKVIFDLPTRYDKSLQKYVVDEGFVPLLRNQDGEVISYIGYIPDVGYEILLPVCEKKDELVYKLISQFLPQIVPDYFPESKTFEWINTREFTPDEIIECELRKEELHKKLEDEIAKIDEEEERILIKYKFLRDILIETGQTLVNAVCEYLRWLGFTNVKSMDGSEAVLREDIQIDDGEKLYIIEVKGIGGTSTDAECSQVAKHRRKREKENRDKEVIPIYIVNHQRYIRPTSRQNPPFSKDQMDYAKSDERGLLTTWQMYQQYKLIENGVFSKEETKNTLCKPGLITMIPDSIKYIGKFEEYFKRPKAGIIIIDEFEVHIGDNVWARKDENWVKTKIVSIQLNDNTVESVKSGEVGMVTEVELGKGYEIFMQVK